MKKLLYTITALSLVFNASAKTEVLELDNAKVHFYQSGDAMGDNSLIIESNESLVLLEPLPFFADMKGINDYVKSLNKPLKVVVANYHPFGMSNYEGVEVVMPKAMKDFSGSEVFAGISAKFKKIFGEQNMDFSMPKNPKLISVGDVMDIDGVKVKFLEGAKSDFPALSVLIDDKVYYSHFSPAKSHISSLQIRDRGAIDAVLADLQNIKASGAEYILSSHGGVSSQAEVDFQISYLNKVKELLAKAKSADDFALRLVGAYPNLDGYKNLRELSKALYPQCEDSAEVEALKVAMNAYFESVSTGDEALIKEVWADSSEVSLVNGRGHFIGIDSLLNDFFPLLRKNGNKVKLYSSAENVTILSETSALIQLYWVFETTTANGEFKTGRGRESLIFNKIYGKWKLMHVHYSPLPQS